MKLPDTIRIGPHDFKVVIVPPAVSERFGYNGGFSCDDLQITLSSGYKGSRLVEIFLHEMNHAVYWVTGMRPDDDEERTVDALAMQWSQIYRDNPVLLKWIKQSLSSK